MRIRTALASVAIASTAIVGMSTQAAHAASWHFTGQLYTDKSPCVDAGQQYEREGFPYKCELAYFKPTDQFMYWLFIYN